jgi:hypothetical protein
MPLVKQELLTLPEHMRYPNLMRTTSFWKKRSSGTLIVKILESQIIPNSLGAIKGVPYTTGR